MKKVLMSGGSGLLGKEMIKINEDHHLMAPSSSEMNILDRAQIDKQILKSEPEIFLHCAALTRPMDLHDQHPGDSIEQNIIGTANIVLSCINHGIKLVYISTDYVYPGGDGNYTENADLQPINQYAWSKLGGECAVRLYKNSLILRAAFASKPFPHKKAFTDSYKSYLYFDEMAPLILKVIDKDIKGTLNIGGDRRSAYDFAKLSESSVGKITREEVGSWVPKDTSMNIEKLKSLLDER